MSELNKKQKEAAEFKDGVCCLVAVPGSGKTRTMTERIGILVKKHQIPPENILGLTFTRNAAEEMRSRLVPVLEDKAERVMLNTIHSFCLHLLKREKKIFELLTGKEQIIFIREIIKKLKIKEISTGIVICEISLAKNNLISIEEFRSLYEGDKTMLQVADIAKVYEREKKKKLLMDFDDLLFEVYTLLLENTEIRDKYRDIYRHLCVDEWQDTNPLQMEIIKLLVDGSNSNGSSFWVCGDDAQSIYSFTGASVSNIVGFQEIFPDSKLLILNLNYRSTPQIVKACQNLINHNIRKIDKTLETHNKDGDDPIVLECISEEDEALQLVYEINDLVSRGYEHKNIAVLYRANFQSRVIEEKFSEHKVPYYIENGLNFYQRREVKILLDYLRVIHNPNSDEGDEALVNILNVPNRYIGRKFITELNEYASKKEIHLYEALKSMSIALPYVKKNVKEFITFLSPLIGDAGSMVPSEILSIIREVLEYDRFITEDEIPTPDDVKIQNINQFQLASARFSTIESFLEYTETFQDTSVDDKDGVSLMTIHKAKGLEFPIIFVIGLVEGILPNRRTENLEEERRICFVGISRAMNLLYISYSHIYLSQPAKKSIFIEEILGTKETQ